LTNVFLNGIIKATKLNIRKLLLIKSGGGTGPMKPGNRKKVWVPFFLVPIPAGIFKIPGR